MVDSRIGEYAFILGVLVSVVAGLAVGLVAAYSGWIALALVILGLIVGFLNLAEKEIQPFLIAAIGLMVVGTANLVVIDLIIPLLGTVLQAIVQNIAIFVAPAALVVALKAVYKLSRRPTV